VVEPRKFQGRLIHKLPETRCPFGDLYFELYFAEPSQENEIGLYKGGTRVLSDISRLDRFSKAPWNSKYLEGMIDAPFLQLTPGTRDGIVLDEAYESFCIALEPVEEALLGLLEEKRKAEEDEASKQILGRVTRAFREAFLHLPSEEYGWLAAKVREPRRKGSLGGLASENGSRDIAAASGMGLSENSIGEIAAEADASFGECLSEPIDEEDAQKSFFDYAGPLHKLMVSPASSVIGVGEKKKLKALARDRSGRTIDTGVDYEWRIVDGGGSLEGIDGAYSEYVAPDEPCVASVELRAAQGETTLVASALVTVTAELIRHQAGAGGTTRRGLPGYTYQRAPGELWRSRYDEERSVIVINNAHADFIFASRQAMTKVRYITRLFAKELVLSNFPESDKAELLERMVELTLYAEESLK
jgi:hypothetical protein